MSSSHQRLSGSEVQELRREGGRVLKRLREDRGLSQRELCARVDGGVYTLISQLENGRGRIPPDKLRLWAEALGVEARDLVIMLLPYYDPSTAAILFKDENLAPEVTAVEKPVVKSALHLVKDR